ncbi:MAG TPA: hypothetical protein VGY66_27480 [Gemmataceae bacterium]|jgi:hypothetical protein|nr:hypothetical protein [Gemmataceae bacterium]
MNECEAFAEAKRRWGKEAHVRYSQGKLAEGAKPYAVGKWLGRQFQVLGQGDSWQAAFEQAR